MRAISCLHARGFGIWREDKLEIILRVLHSAFRKSRCWRFHPAQVLEEDGDELLVKLRAGGLGELAEYRFSWGATSASKRRPNCAQ
ncbi:hypothetical protein [Novosphingobium decolorationis]|uniref:Uncharacterized protein n=1 Tax=Novosphingobium decolorationis TaxID=2698673 RepID=A0ABX8E7N4_9SPHN|nr:hypothetical protein [Novosphingobium decolorationis]QVM85187.1 hypothetical protein HT578_17125 [Novosphingobium decolorationis]